MEDTSYLDLRNKTVVKANTLIQNSRFNLSLQQQKILLFLISQINAYDEQFKLYEFDLIQFCKYAGIDYDNGKNYIDIKKAIKEIADKSLWVELEEDEETLLRWIEKPYINKRQGIIKIRLDEDMKPFLLQLKANFTSYEIIWTLKFQSKYSVRMYELAKSLHYNELEIYTRRYPIDELKKLLGAEHYKEYRDFKRKALIPAIKEVNKYSDKNIVFEEITRGRKVLQIQLYISTKEAMDRIKIRSDIEHELGLTQMTLWDTLEEKGYN